MNARPSPVKQPDSTPHTNVSFTLGHHKSLVFGSTILQSLHGAMIHPNKQQKICIANCFTSVQAPVPFSMPAGTANQAVRADSLDIFGSTSLTGGKPAAQPVPVLASTPAPAVIASPVKGAAVGNSPNSPAQQKEPYVADGASTPDDGNSPEGIVTRLHQHRLKRAKKSRSVTNDTMLMPGIS